jgi:DICT domain-containing protein
MPKIAAHEDVAALVSKMWHFPTVSVRSDAASELREIVVELGVRAARDSKLRFEPLSRARHTVTYRAVKILPYRVVLSRLPRIAGTKVVLLSELVARSTLAVSNLTRKIAQVAG